MRSLQVTQLDIRKLRATKMTFFTSGIVKRKKYSLEAFKTIFNPGRKWMQALTS